MSIKYDGHTLCLNTPDLEKFCESTRFFPVDLFGDYPQAESHGYMGGCDSNKVPVPNYSADRTPRLNTLIWPTGASRWAYGLFLATKTVINQLSYGEAKTLEMVAENQDQKHTKVRASMYALAPVQLSCVEVEFDGTAAEQLWLLPLVDARWYWQWRNTGSISVSSSSTWADVISSLGSQLGVSITTTIRPNYDTPPNGMSNAIKHGCCILLVA